jgi:hypothetical protein
MVAATQQQIAVAMVMAHMEIHISDLLAWARSQRGQAGLVPWRGTGMQKISMEP